MKKIVAVFLAIIFCSIQISFAVGDVPKDKVSVSPVGGKVGSAITISAFLYNDQKETMTFTLEAKAGDTVLAKPVVTLASGSAKTIAIAWKEPKAQTTVTVNIISALNAKRVDVPALHGTLGIVLVGSSETPPSTPSAPLSTGAFGKVFDSSKSFLETFRVTQATHFAKERDAVKAKLGIQKTDTSGVIESGASGTDDLPQIKKVDNPMDYGMLILSTALASFFASSLMFYGALALITLLLIRALFKMFV